MSVKGAFGHFDVLWCCVWQIPLMAALPATRAALEAHRDVSAVAEHGLGFLMNLATAEANRVRWTPGRV